MSTEPETRVPLIGYLSAATIAAVIPFLSTQLLVFINQTDPVTIFFSIFLSSLIGGVCSGYLLRRRFGKTNLYSTTIIGFLAYILFNIFNIINGFILEVNDFFILVAFIFGGVIGYRIFDNLKKGELKQV